MSKFLTPPVWYDKNGNLNEMLTGNNNTTDSIAIGISSSTGSEAAVAIGKNAYVHTASDHSVSIGNGANSYGENSVSIGNGANSYGRNSVIIGNGASTDSAYSIAIGHNARALADYNIQLGGNDTQYNLTVGNENGISKIGALRFNQVTPTDISSSGLYWCTATQTLGPTSVLCCNAFLWIQTPNSTQASATDGSATFSYGNQGGSGDWAIRASGSNVSNLKCYKVFA